VFSVAQLIFISTLHNKLLLALKICYNLIVMIENALKLALFIVLLLLSAFFSASETAIFSLGILEKENLRRKAGSRLKFFLDLINTKPEHVLITILTGNMIVNVFATAIFDTMFFSENRNITSVLISISIMTGILLITGEMTPKNIAVRSPLAITRFITLPLLLVYGFLTPLRIGLNKLREIFLIKVTQKGVDKNIISTTIKIGLKEGIINQLEYSLFESYFSFNRIIAADIMIPRTEIISVDINSGLKQIIHDIRCMRKKLKSSYVLVFAENVDNPLGYIEVKDLLPFQFSKIEETPLRSIIKPLHSIPESKKLDQLMKEMKDLNCGMALVVDEYGGTAGIITFQNLIESFLSFFYTLERDLIEEIARGKYSVPGTLELKTLNEALSLHIDSASRTVAGLVMEHLGEIPQEGSTVDLAEAKFTVVKTLKNRIKRILIEVNR
jgi:putative hemolysin